MRRLGNGAGEDDAIGGGWRLHGKYDSWLIFLRETAGGKWEASIAPLPLAPEATRPTPIQGVYSSTWDAKIAAENRIRAIVESSRA